MTITHRIALDPTDVQETLLRQHAGWARFAWNWAVEESRRALDAHEKRATSPYRLRRLFNSVKQEIAPWCENLSQNAAKYAMIDIGTAWERFWKARKTAKAAGKPVPRHSLPPKFHSRKRGMAFRADNGPDTVRCQGRRIRLPVIGTVRTREQCRFNGPVQECTVKHDGIRWHASVVCNMAPPERKEDGAVVGVDAGLKRLATVHDGSVTTGVDNPRPLKKALSKLRAVNRRIARSRTIHGKNRRSNRRERLYDERRRLYLRTTHLRVDAAHKATTAIAKLARTVCVETLNVAGWLRNRSLARATADAVPGRFLALLAWKCAREGTKLVAVDRSRGAGTGICGVSSGNARRRIARRTCARRAGWCG